MLVRKKHLLDHHCFSLNFPSDGSGGRHYSVNYRLTGTVRVHDKNVAWFIT